MGAPKVSDWRKLPLSLTELCIDTTLRCGRTSPWFNSSLKYTCSIWELRTLMNI
jgi:N-glycosylase/DNA lyase